MKMNLLASIGLITISITITIENCTLDAYENNLDCYEIVFQ